MSIAITAILFIFILSILVLVHEAGHFFAAKKAGMRVDEFGLGLPPKIWSWKSGETEFSLNALPIGGFVRIYGETPDGVSIREGTDQIADQDRTFMAKSIWRRAGVLLAGVASNLVLGMLLFSIVYAVGLPQYSAKPVIDQVESNSPAAAAGFQAGQTILELNHVKYDDIQPDFATVIKNNRGKEITVTLQDKNGTIHNLTVTPRTTAPANQGLLGITIAGQPYIAHTEKYPLYQAWLIGIKEAFIFAGTILAALGGMLVNLFQHHTVPADLAGPVGIASVVGQARQLGFIPVLWFMGILSINLAVVNVLPFPALDGGRLLFVAIEAITGKKPNPVFERWTHTIGMAILLTLILLITFSDIRRLF
jgi:regulator of sigma E protease